MARAVVEYVGGPACGEKRVIQLVAPGKLPDLISGGLLAGLGQYHATGQQTAHDRHRYDWRPEHTGRRRPPCDRHHPLRPGCPGYQSQTEPHQK